MSSSVNIFGGPGYCVSCADPNARESRRELAKSSFSGPLMAFFNFTVGSFDRLCVNLSFTGWGDSRTTPPFIIFKSYGNYSKRILEKLMRLSENRKEFFFKERK
jgi:hypothetical protein